MNRATRRYYRSLFLILAALGVLVWVTLDQFDVPLKDAMALVLGTVSVVAVTIVFAALVAGLWIALRKWMGRGDSE